MVFSFCLCKGRGNNEVGAYLMLKKLCKCGKTIDVNENMCDECNQKRHKIYDRYHRERKEIYHSKQWSKVRSVCKARYHGIDVFHYMTTGKIIYGTLAHHIIEVSEDKAKAYDVDNLIWVSAKSHAKIHEMYGKNKKETQKLLKNFQKNFLNRGKGKKF